MTTAKNWLSYFPLHFGYHIPFYCFLVSKSLFLEGKADSSCEADVITGEFVWRSSHSLLFTAKPKTSLFHMAILLDGGQVANWLHSHMLSVIV